MRRKDVDWQGIGELVFVLFIFLLEASLVNRFWIGVVFVPVSAPVFWPGLICGLLFGAGCGLWIGGRAYDIEIPCLLVLLSLVLAFTGLGTFAVQMSSLKPKMCAPFAAMTTWGVILSFCIILPGWHLLQRSKSAAAAKERDEKS